MKTRRPTDRGPLAALLVALLMAYDASDHEASAWSRFTQGEVSHLAADERLIEATTAALFNPYFLLRH